jgi:hypothetical protein
MQTVLFTCYYDVCEFSAVNMVLSIKCVYLYRFPIVEPDYGHTKLRLSQQGLDAIRRIETPIAVVGVIGPYRSGKSFLLNQLLSLSCEKGRLYSWCLRCIIGLRDL